MSDYTGVNKPFHTTWRVVVTAILVALAWGLGMFFLGYGSGRLDVEREIKSAICEDEGHTWEDGRCFDPVEVKLP